MGPQEIRAIRERLGLSQAAFARRLGSGLRTIQHWESGDRAPRGAALVLLRKLARTKGAGR